MQRWYLYDQYYLEHNKYILQTFVTFVDLVKAFDTDGHELLIKVMEIYRAPPIFLSAIHIMYEDLIVVLNIVKGIEEIIQEVGVTKVDNMAPILFLFLIANVSESSEEIW